MKYLTLALVFLFGTAFATGNDDCDHPRFQEVGCSYPGEQGEDGADGKDGRDGIDGIDGIDGRDGIDGLNGKDGRDGIDGRDGVVSEKWINETRYKFDRYAHYSAAYSAIQIHLPQDRGSRLTAGVGQSYGETGYGLGYAYKWDDRDDNLAFTFGVGTSGGDEAYKASLGFEFGGDRSRDYDDTRLERLHYDVEERLYELEQRFENEKRGWNEEVQACAAEMDDAREVYERVEDKFMECLQK